MQLKTIFLSVIVVLFLSGCGSNQSFDSDYWDDRYSLEVVFEDNESKEFNKVYKVFGQSVTQTANQILEKDKEPIGKTKKDDKHMYILYDNQLVHIYQDLNKNNSIVDVSDKGFVRNSFSNESIHILQTYMFAKTVKNHFDTDWELNEPQSVEAVAQDDDDDDDHYHSGGSSYFYTRHAGSYNGYIHNGQYVKSIASSGSVKMGSVTTRGIRGGGPNAGK